MYVLGIFAEQQEWIRLYSHRCLLINLLFTHYLFDAIIMWHSDTTILVNWWVMQRGFSWFARYVIHRHPSTCITSYGFFVQHEFGCWLLFAARIYRRSSRIRRRATRWQNRSRGKTLRGQAALTSSTQSRGCIQKRGGAWRKAEWWSIPAPRSTLGLGSDRKRCRETRARATWNGVNPLLNFFTLVGLFFYI